MSIITEVKREYRKLSSEVESNQRRMKALEVMMREYKIWQYPYSAAISDLVVDFVANQGGEASYDAIAKYLEDDKNIEIQHQKLSLILNRKMHYNRQAQKWEIKSDNENAA